METTFTGVQKWFLHNVLCGGDLDEMIDFQTVNYVHWGQTNEGGDLIKTLKFRFSNKKIGFGLPFDMVKTI